MNHKKINRVCAEIDGWTEIDSELYGYVPDHEYFNVKNPEESRFRIPNYVASYNDIIPLISRLNDEVKKKVWWYLGNEEAYQLFDYSPKQFCIALIKAIGRWENL